MSSEDLEDDGRLVDGRNIDEALEADETAQFDSYMAQHFPQAALAQAQANPASSAAVEPVADRDLDTHAGSRPDSNSEDVDNAQVDAYARQHFPGASGRP